MDGLARQRPDMSARHTLSGGQGLFLAVGLIVVLAAWRWTGLLPTLIGLNALVILMYFASLLYQAAWFGQVLRRPWTVSVSEEEARSWPESRLPDYSVLVPAFHEAEVMPELVRSLERIDYPRDRVEVKLLLEADDDATIAAARRLPLPDHFEVVLVPPVGPRTKPKACNYGLQLSSGELVTIFDAEDRPDPLQLRRAAIAFQRLPSRVACLQSKLYYYNSRQNLITRLFSAEYITWFGTLLPALAAMGAPIPLGGTSMHIRRATLESVGAWDPHNVTEDADLGMRLHRLGYETRILDSITFEEANSDFVNWERQRSRWYKGYLQTWLVHSRHPLRLLDELGGKAFIGFNMVLLGTPLLALLNPIFWGLTMLWFVAKPHFLQELFPMWLYYPGMVSMVAGNFLAIFRSLVSLRSARESELIPWLVLLPLYWLMMSVAAIRAFAQLLLAPFVWDKTVHGLDTAEVQVADG